MSDSDDLTLQNIPRLLTSTSSQNMFQTPPPSERGSERDSGRHSGRRSRRRSGRRSGRRSEGSPFPKHVQSHLNDHVSDEMNNLIEDMRDEIGPLEERLVAHRKDLDRRHDDHKEEIKQKHQEHKVAMDDRHKTHQEEIKKQMQEKDGYNSPQANTYSKGMTVYYTKEGNTDTVQIIKVHLANNSLSVIITDSYEKKRIGLELDVNILSGRISYKQNILNKQKRVEIKL